MMATKIICPHCSVKYDDVKERRDRFAAAALNGILAVNDRPFLNDDNETYCVTVAENQRVGAKVAVGYADALIAELDKKHT
jgi:hypothetical protein